MIVEVLATAEEDLWAGFNFYDQQISGLGDYFLRSLRSDIIGLRLTAGIHSKRGKLFRIKSKHTAGWGAAGSTAVGSPVGASFAGASELHFPHSIYYFLKGNVIYVLMVLDVRQAPSKIHQREKKEQEFFS